VGRAISRGGGREASTRGGVGVVRSRGPRWWVQVEWSGEPRATSTGQEGGASTGQARSTTPLREAGTPGSGHGEIG
jgi:hypothetical protein